MCSAFAKHKTKNIKGKKGFLSSVDWPGDPGVFFFLIAVSFTKTVNNRIQNELSVSVNYFFITFVLVPLKISFLSLYLEICRGFAEIYSGFLFIYF